MHILSFLLVAVTAAKGSHLSASDCGSSYRAPRYTDISVDCGASSVRLAILICPAIFSGYNESLIFPNNEFGNPACVGTLDDSATPPVLRFHIPFNTTNACGSDFTTTSAPGTGVFSDFSNVKTVNMSGVVRSYDRTVSDITYHPELKYHYSCAYPLEYVVNEFRFGVSAATIAMEDTNGSFVSTLKLELFRDVNYTEPMRMTSAGIELRTNIYAQVRATNLTAQYHVLLERCYTSIYPHPTDSTSFDLFLPCSIHNFTTIVENGQSHSARFYFKAFRFSEQHDEMVSTYYLHCITRLCEATACGEFKLCAKRKRRHDRPSARSQSTTLTSQIVTKTESLLSKDETMGGGAGAGGSSVGLAVAVGVLAFLCVVVLCAAMAAIFHRKRSSFNS